MSERFLLQGNSIILDRETGLAWQRGASEEPMVWKDGFEYVENLNKSRFAGFDDWRLPTKEELGALIMPEEDRVTGLYLSPLFEGQRNCWTGDEAGHHRAAYVDFYYGDIYLVEGNYANLYIRAVRQSQQ